METLAQRLQGQRLGGVLLDVTADGLDQFKLRVVGDMGVGLAAFAGSKAGLSRQLWHFEKEDVLPLRFTGRARRAAVNSRGAHRQNKFAVKRGVSIETGLPKGFFG